MAEFIVTDPDSGRTVTLTGDSAPTEQELVDIFGSLEPAAPFGTQARVQNLGGGRLQIPGVEREPGAGFLETEALSTVGAALGEMAGGAGGLRVPGPPLVKVGASLLGQAAGAFLGGAGGDVLQGQVQEFVDSPFAPEDLDAALTRAQETGEREALFSLVFGTTFATGGEVMRRFGVNPAEGMEEIQNILDKRGTSLSLGQAVDDTVFGSVFKGMEELLRGAPLTSGPFERLRDQQISAFMDEFVERAGRDLTPASFGRVVQDTINQGGKLHNEIASAKFGFLDEQLAVLPTPLREAGLAPVDLTSVRSFAQQTKNSLDKLGLSDETAEGVSTLAKFARGDNRLTFKETHELLSNLKTMSREKTLAKNSKRQVKALIDQVQTAWDDSADALAPGLKAQYTDARDFFREGAEVFNDKLLVKLLNKDASVLGNRLSAAATPEDISRIRAGYRKAASASGRSFDDMWGEFQRGASQQFWPQSGSLGDVLREGPAAADDFLSAPIFNMSGKKGRKLRGTFEAIYGKDTAQNMLRYSEALRGAMQSSTAGGLAGRQAAAVFTVAAGGAAGVLSGPFAAVAALVGIPALASSAFTNKAFVTAMTRWVAQKPGSQGATTAFLRLVSVADDIAEEEDLWDEIETFALDVVQPLPPIQGVQ